MIKAYSVFAYYGNKETVNDILNFIRNNPMHLDFGEFIDYSFNTFTNQMYICVGIEVFDYAILKEFALTAELLHEEV